MSFHHYVTLVTCNANLQLLNYTFTFPPCLNSYSRMQTSSSFHTPNPSSQPHPPPSPFHALLASHTQPASHVSLHIFHTTFQYYSSIHSVKQHLQLHILHIFPLQRSHPGIFILRISSLYNPASQLCPFSPHPPHIFIIQSSQSASTSTSSIHLTSTTQPVTQLCLYLHILRTVLPLTAT